MRVDPFELLDELHARGGTFRVVDGTIKVRGPEEVLNSDLIERLRSVKEELIHRFEAWDFRSVEVPSQVYPGQIDIWMIGRRTDRSGNWKAWYVGTEKQNSEE